MKRLAPILATLLVVAVQTAPAAADELLESAITDHLAAGALALPVSLGRKEMAADIATIECDYQLGIADNAFISIEEGASIQDVRAVHRELAEPEFILDFIDRQSDFRADGPTGSVKARILQAVSEACANAAEGIVETIPAG